MKFLRTRDEVIIEVTSIIGLKIGGPYSNGDCSVYALLPNDKIILKSFRSDNNGDSKFKAKIAMDSILIRLIEFDNDYKISRIDMVDELNKIENNNS